MKYRIPEYIVIEQNDNETVKDIIYHEFNEQEFLIKFLQNPRLSYWKDSPDGTKQHYRNGELQVTIKDSVVINNYFNKKI
jgi:hypothetical protein